MIVRSEQRGPFDTDRPVTERGPFRRAGYDADVPGHGRSLERSLIVIDGSHGEGGGQILRTALALSIITGKPFRLENVRARRSKPGLLRQHLAAVNAATVIGQAVVEGAELGSKQLAFLPGQPKCGDYFFSIGSAGSTTLVLQTVLPVLLTMNGSCSLVVEGGTHNSGAPPFDFFAKAFVPLLRAMGASVDAELLRYGFYPAGGGKVSVRVNGPTTFLSLNLEGRGQIVSQRATALVANLPLSIAERELTVIAERMSWPVEWLHADTTADSNGPGNVVTIEIESEHVTEIFTGFGARGVRAEDVAESAIEELQDYLVTPVAAGPHLADQLLVPMAIGAGGTFTTGPLTEHTLTNIDVIKRFVNVQIDVEEVERGINAFRVTV